MINVGSTSFFLDDCDALTAWNSSGSLSLNSIDKKQGDNCIQYNGSCANEFQKVFSTPYNSGISENDAVLQFWYYLSDASKLGSSNQVEIGSSGTNDQNEYNWSFIMLNKTFIRTISTVAISLVTTFAITFNAQAEIKGPVSYVIPFGPGGESDISARFQQS